MNKNRKIYSQLTEDWKEGKLGTGVYYYILMLNDTVQVALLYCNSNDDFVFEDYNSEDIKEVLARCDYEELKRLKEYETLYHRAVGEIYNLRSLLKKCKEFLYMYPTSEIDSGDLYRKLINILGE